MNMEKLEVGKLVNIGRREIKMSCEDCEKIQNLAFNKNIDESPDICYIRIGNSNLALVGCEKHLKEAINKLRRN
jgi:hypothetical protein